VIKGEFAVGYSVNNEEYLALKMCDRNPIGDISIMFKRRSEFFYKALSDMDCQAIRRHSFFEVMERYPEFAVKLKARAFNRYKDLIRKPVLEHKNKTYEKIFRVHPSERTKEGVIDMTVKDEKAILKEMEDIYADGETQLTKILKLEKNYENITNCVLGIY
jgi:hypothetical protein